MGRLASRAATNKLGQILGLLVVPIVILWAFYFQSAKSSIDALSNRLVGVELAQAHLSPGQEDARAQRRLEAAIRIPQRPQAASEKSGRAVGKLEGMARSARYLLDVAQASGLSLDGDWQSDAFTEVALEMLPALHTKLAAVVAGMDGKISTNGVSPSHPMDPAMAFLAAGEISGLQRQAEELLLRTSLAQKQGTTAAIAEQQKMVQHIERATSALTLPFISDKEKAETMQSVVAAYAAFESGPAKQLQPAILTALQKRLQNRQQVQWRYLIVVTAAGVASALAGLGLAVLLMRSTFNRLDAVEVANHEAQVARQEAEQMALRFSNINADISNLNQELAQKVRELKVAQDELIKKGRMEQLGQLTATIAHEIRNPLGAVRTSAFLLKRKLDGKGLGVEGQLDRINKGVDRCDDIITQLLDYSRTRAVNATEADLDEWLSGVVREEAGRMPQQVYVECHLGLDGQKVPFDPARLQRAVINLLGNACEAFSGKEHRASGKASTLQVSTFCEGGHAVIRVRDNGPGISPENLARIKEPLFTTKSFGTGLGLPAVEQIAAQHGGRLEVQSVVGQGATFSIYLSLTTESREAA